MRPLNLPDPSEHDIFRGHLLDGLVSQTETNSIAIVTGKPNVGKTVLLAQFYDRHAENAIALFVSGSSSWGYEYEMIAQDLCEQVRGLTGWKGQRQGLDLETSSTNWNAAVAELGRWARSGKRTVYFVVDGLDEIPEQDSTTATAIFKLLPLGLTPFRFLVSGQRAMRMIRDAKVKNYGEFFVTDFTKEETLRYLGDFLPPETSNQVYAISRGLPGYCATVRRVFAAHGSVQQPLPDSVPQFFEYEWSKVGGRTEIEQLVAFICFDKQIPTKSRLAALLSRSPEEVQAMVDSVSFLECRSDTIVFPADSFRAFAQRKVQGLQKQTIDAIIEKYYADGSSDDSVRFLPELLSQAGRDDQVIRYLNDDYVLSALRQKRAARFIQERTVIGLRAAAKAERTDDVIRYGLQGANLDALYLDEHWTARINAYVSVGLEEKALAIARSFVTPEDRIQGLCVVAAHQKNKQGAAPTSVIEEITREHGLLDKDHLGARAYDISADLIFVAPNLALDLVQNISRVESEESAQRLQAHAHTMQGTAVDDPDKCAANALQILNNRITDPNLRSISKALSATSRGQTAEQVLSEINGLANDEEKQYFLRIWLAENRTHANRGAVIQFAFEFIRSSKVVTPAPGFILEIVRAGRNLPNSLTILEEVRTLTPLLKRLGPTADYHRLMLSVYEQEAGLGRTATQADFEILLNESSSLDDIALRGFIASEQLLAMERMKEKKVTWLNKQHIQNATNILDDSVSSILSSTADHYQCLRRTIATLARFDCRKAHDIVLRINTESRRDRAHMDLVYSAIVLRVRGADIVVVGQSFREIHDAQVKARCLHSVLNGLLTIQSKVELFNVQSLEAWCREIEDPIVGAHTLSLLALILVKYTSKTFQETTWLRERADARLELIISPIDRVATLYKLASTIADYDQATAVQYLNQAEEMRRTLFVKTRGIEHCLLLNAHVNVRAFSGLMKRKAWDQVGYSTLLSMIDKLSDPTGQIIIYNELATRFALADDIARCRDITSLKISTILANLPPELPALKHALTVTAAPSLYAANPISCLSILEELPPRARENAIGRILKMIIAKLPADEPEEERLTLPTTTTTAQLEEILKLLGHVEDDASITHIIHVITRHLCSNRIRSTRAEVEQIRSKIEKLIAAKLPSSRFTAHNGYILLARGFVLQLKQANAAEWQPLLDEVARLPNVSDRCFIFGAFVDVQGPKLLALRKKLLNEAIELADKIPVQYDRADRLIYLAEIARDIDQGIFQTAIKRVLAVPAGTELDDRSMDIRRRAVDMVYFQNDVLANTLVSALDDDPARDIRTVLRKRIDFLELQKKVIDQRTEGVDLKNADDLPHIFFRYLKQLNSGRMQAPSFRQLAPLFLGIEGRRIEDVFPMLSFGIEACVKRYADTAEASGILTRISRSCLDSTKILVRCLVNQGEGSKVTPAQVAREDGNNIIIRKSERELAVDFIRRKLAQSQPGQIYIADPYFSANELDLIELIIELFPQTPIIVMTSVRHVAEKHGIDTARQAFRDAWKLRGIEATDLRIHIVGLKGNGDAPIHERMILCDSVGIKIGGSWNGIGGEKETDLSVLDKAETQAWAETLEKYVLYMQRLHNGIVVEYEVFSL